MHIRCIVTGDFVLDEVSLDHSKRERERELLSTVVVIQLIYLLLQSTIEAIAVCFGGEAVLFVIVILVVVCNARRFFIIE